MHLDVRKLVRQRFHLSRRVHIRPYRDRLADAWETGEGIEGINSFLNKSVPSWRVK